MTTIPRVTDPNRTQPIIPRNTAYESNSGYSTFITALERACLLNRICPDNVRWVEAEPVTGLVNIPPRIALAPNDKSPAFAISLDPTVERKSIAGVGYHAPLLLINETNWGIKSESLGNYLLTGFIGVPDAEANFDEPISLNQFISNCPFEQIQGQLRQVITNETPVIEIAGLLPFAERREFNTEFNPVFISQGKNLVILIYADKVLSSPCVYRDSGGPFQYRDAEGKPGNWHADRIPDLSEAERATMPSSAGHFIAISIPLQDEYYKSLNLPVSSGFGGGDRFRDNPMGSMRSRGFSGGDLSGLTLKGSDNIYNPLPALSYLLATLDREGKKDPRGAAVSGVNVTGGSQRRETTKRYTGDLTLDPDRKAAIYHVSLFGVTPEVANRLDTSALASALGSIGNFQVLNN